MPAIKPETSKPLGNAVYEMLHHALSVLKNDKRSNQALLGGLIAAPAAVGIGMASGIGDKPKSVSLKRDIEDALASRDISSVEGQEKMAVDVAEGIKMGLIGAGVAGVPAYFGTQYMANNAVHQQLAEEERKIHDLMNTYNTSVRGNVLADAGVTPEELEAKKQELMTAGVAKGASEMSTTGKVLTGITGALLGGSAYNELSKGVEKRMPEVQKMEEFRDAVNRVVRSGQHPAAATMGFSPEELIALESLRASKAKPKRRIKVSANTEDPALGKLLASV